MRVAEAAELQAWRQAFGLTAQATDGSRNQQQEGIVAHGGRMREPTTDPVESRESVCPEDFLQVRWSSTVMWCCRSRLLSVSVLCAAERHGGRQESTERVVRTPEREDFAQSVAGAWAWFKRSCSAEGMPDTGLRQVFSCTS